MCVCEIITGPKQVEPGFFRNVWTFFSAYSFASVEWWQITFEKAGFQAKCKYSIAFVGILPNDTWVLLLHRGSGPYPIK